jgi:hypothetical protein
MNHESTALVRKVTGNVIRELRAYEVESFNRWYLDLQVGPV